MKKISVCMATRNGGRFLRPQLESILRQLGPDDELIISDDSSTDDTVAIIGDFGDARIRLFENNTFYSPIFNVENALKRATGDIIVLSDQDDIWLDNKVSLVRDRLQDRLDSVYLVMFDGYVIDDSGKIIHQSIFAGGKAGKGILKNIYDNTYVGCNLAFTRPLLDIALPFPQKIPMHDMWLGLLGEIFGTVEFVEEKTILYRRHSANATPFSFSFDPIPQVRRRFSLVSCLMRRYMDMRRKRKG